MYTKFNNLYQEENLNQILLDLLAGYSKIKVKEILPFWQDLLFRQEKTIITIIKAMITMVKMNYKQQLPMFLNYNNKLLLRIQVLYNNN